MSTNNIGNPASPYPGSYPGGQPQPPVPQPPAAPWGQAPQRAAWPPQVPPPPQPQPPVPQPPAAPWQQTPQQAPWASQTQESYGAPEPAWGGGYATPPEKPKPPVVLWVLIGVVVVALIAASVYLFTRPKPVNTTTSFTPTLPTSSQTITLTPSYAPTDTSTDNNGDQPWYRDMSGQVTASTDVDSAEFQVGDCVENISDSGDTIYTLPLVPCTTPHEAEVYAIGSGVTNTKAGRTKFCQNKFKSYVGSNWDETALSVTWIYTQGGSTTDIQCMIYQKGKMVTTTYKGSKM